MSEDQDLMAKIGQLAGTRPRVILVLIDALTIHRSDQQV